MRPQRATVFGAHGFIGGRLCSRLRSQGWEVLALGRGDDYWRSLDLGHAFFCIGLTADFRKRPFETIDAHVNLATEILREAHFDSFLYLSSTRVYLGSNLGDETSRLQVNPGDPNDLYNLSKLMGEAACLALDRPEVRIARLSNVFGDGMCTDNFLASVIREAAETGSLILRQALDSAKDYVAIGDVIDALVRIAIEGQERLYNVATGRNTSHAEITEAVRALTGCRLSVEPGSLTASFPQISVDRIESLGIRPSGDVLAALPGLIQSISDARQVNRR